MDGCKKLLKSTISFLCEKSSSNVIKIEIEIVREVPVTPVSVNFYLILPQFSLE